MKLYNCHHTNVREPQACLICQATFIYECELIKHKQIVHDEKKLFQCSYCTLSFSGRYKLSEHMAFEHEGRKEFECSRCGMKFKRVLNWKQHLSLVHKVIKPFNCWICNEQFSKKPELKKHIAVVHDKTKLKKSHGSDIFKINHDVKVEDETNCSDDSKPKIVENKWNISKPEYYDLKREDIVNSDYPKLILDRLKNKRSTEN